MSRLKLNGKSCLRIIKHSGDSTDAPTNSHWSPGYTIGWAKRSQKPWLAINIQSVWAGCSLRIWILEQGVYCSSLLTRIFTHLVHVPPIFVITEALPEHCQNLITRHHVVRQVRDIGHLGARRAPGVIRGRFSNLNDRFTRNQRLGISLSCKPDASFLNRNEWMRSIERNSPWLLPQRSSEQGSSVVVAALSESWWRFCLWT